MEPLNISSGTPNPELQLMQVEMQSPNIWNADFIISCHLDEEKKMKLVRFEPGIFSFTLYDFIFHPYPEFSCHDLEKKTILHDRSHMKLKSEKHNLDIR